jgi:cytosine/adenosine deaminase-related metal-dependent hydrolase
MTVTLVRGKYVIERVLDRDTPVIHEDGAVAVEGDKVVAIGAHADLAARWPEAEVLGSADHVVLPGLVNSHHHVGLTPVQLGSLDQPLELWFATRMVARDVDLHLDTLYSAFEMIASGITTVQHLHGRVPGPIANVERGALKVIGAYQALGMRVSYAFGYRDQNRLVYEDDAAFIAKLPPDLGARLAESLSRMHITAEEYFGLHGTLAAATREDPRVEVQLAPSNLHWVSDAGLDMFRDYSEAHGTPMHMHLNETAYQKRYARLRSGKTAVGHLKDMGLLGPRLTLGHAVWLTEEDIDTVAETGTLVCHNASSNLRLRSGVACLNCFARRGVRVAMGIDEAGINEDRDMLSEMRLVLRLHRVPGMDPADVPTAPQVLRMASENGGLTTPYGAAIGTLSPGSFADLSLISWKSVSHPYLDPLIPVVDAVLLRAKTQGVETVMIGGEVVMRDGSFTRLDREAALAELAAQLAMSLKPEEERRRELSREILPHVRDFYADYLTGEVREPFYAQSSRV